MNEFLHILLQVLPLLLVIIAGAVTRQWGILSREADQTLMKLVVHILFPAFILSNVMASEALRRWDNLFWAPLLGFFTAALGVFLSLWMAPLFGLKRMESGGRTFAFTTGMYNYGYIPVPLVTILYGIDTLGVLFIFNLGVEVAFWTVGLAVQENRSLGRNWWLSFTTPVRTILFSLAVNLGTACFHFKLDDASLSQVAWGFPLQVILQGIHWIGICATPMALMLIGAIMADYWGDFMRTKGVKVMLGAMLLRNLILPLLFIAMALFLPITHNLGVVLVVQSAMPAALFPLVLARNNGGDTMVALQVIFGTSALALLTLPIWIHLGLLWLK